MTALDVDTLAELLREAKEAHTKYEAKLGAPDLEWPKWYAEYIVERL